MDFNELFFVIAIASFIACLATHILPLIFKRRELFGYLGIALHTLLLISLFLAGRELSFVLLLSMALLTVHAAASYVISRREKRDDL